MLKWMRHLITGYLQRLPAEVADRRLDRLKRAGLEHFSFAWAGHPERGKPHY